jgi:hypothetical protein
MDAPLFSSPVNSDLIFCQNRAFDSPASSSLRDISKPRSTGCVMEKYPVTGAYSAPFA